MYEKCTLIFIEERIHTQSFKDTDYSHVLQVELFWMWLPGESKLKT